ncbi:hypothetical protein HMPREF1862_00920 [Varibaculum cambriense]|uniref:Uncharacterized protein n=1 Tax=Varibaculum cambriense TaxID=184870 RepID=A0AB34X0V8_9ACTO|nr:hypothetical protein HMPREF1862_00920 [Varibaculum cambriense]
MDRLFSFIYFPFDWLVEISGVTLFIRTKLYSRKICCKIFYFCLK